MSVTTGTTAPKALSRNSHVRLALTTTAKEQALLTNVYLVLLAISAKQVLSSLLRYSAILACTVSTDKCSLVLLATSVRMASW